MLYRSAAALFDVSVEDWDRWKNDSLIHVEIISECALEPLVSLTGREFLQRYGTESHREVFGANFWVQALMKNLSAAERYVITDARFANELQAVKYNGGVTWRVERPGIDDGDTHESEATPPANLIDATIDNSGTIEQLYVNVTNRMKGIA